MDENISTYYQMQYNKYIGARYVPLIDGEWDITKAYEPLVIVINQGNSYTSKTYVPAGIDITNENYWVVTGNYNAQVEAYRQEVRDIKKKVDLVRYVTDFGAVGDGQHDDTVAIQQAVSFGGYVVFPAGKYKITSAISVPNHTTIEGNMSTIVHGQSFGFLIGPYMETPTEDNVGKDIHIKNFIFDANGTFDGAIKGYNMRNSSLTGLWCLNSKPIDVSVAIGLVNGCDSINISNCYIDYSDYGIVLGTDSFGEAVNYGTNRINISDCNIRTDYGSGISLNGITGQINIENINVTITGKTNTVGVGIKVFQGTAGKTTRYVNINNVNVTYRGGTVATDAKGLSFANFASNINVTNCNMFNMTIGAQVNYGQNADSNDYVFSNCQFNNCTTGMLFSIAANYNNTSVMGCKFNGCDAGIDGEIYQGSVNGCVFNEVSGIACNITRTRYLKIVNCGFKFVGGNCVKTGGSGATTNYIVVSNNTFDTCCLSDSNVAVISTGTFTLVANGNMCANDTTSTLVYKPTYFVENATNTNNVATGNWLYGFKTAYFANINTGDVYVNNKERGGIGA